MRIKPDQLSGLLTSKPSRIAWIMGEEPYQRLQCADLFRKYWRDNGFSERLYYTIDKGFDWLQLEEQLSAPSLFGDLRIIELSLIQQPDAKGKALLEQTANRLPDDICLILTSEKNDYRILNQKWAKAIDTHGWIIQVWPIDHSRLPGWISARMHEKGLQPTAEAARILADHVEGNLLAAAQEIEKLALLADNPTIDGPFVSRHIVQSSHYSIFDLSDAIIARDAAHALTILRTLRSEGVAPAQILWALNQEAQRLIDLARARQQRQPAEEVVKGWKLPPQKKKRYLSMRPRSAPLLKAINSLHIIDCAIKGADTQPVWPALEEAVLLLSRD